MSNRNYKKEAARNKELYTYFRAGLKKDEAAKMQELLKSYDGKFTKWVRIMMDAQL